MSEDLADPIYRWWTARMRAALGYYAAGTQREGVLAWGVEEVKRLEPHADPLSTWTLLDVLEARVLGEIRTNHELAVSGDT